MEAQEQYLDYLTDVSFQGVNSFFVLQLEDDAIRTENTIFFPQGEIKITTSWPMVATFLISHKNI